MSKLSEILQKHQRGESKSAQSEVISYIQNIKDGADTEWELDQAYGVLEIIADSTGMPIEEIQSEHSEYTSSKFKYWANGYCWDRSRMLVARIDNDDAVAFAEAQKVLALSGIIGFTSPFMEKMCQAMYQYQHRLGQQKI